jgi:hypothetical protein
MATLTPEDQLCAELATMRERLAHAETQLKGTRQKLVVANQSIADLEDLLKVTQKNLRKTYDALYCKPPQL